MPCVFNDYERDMQFVPWIVAAHHLGQHKAGSTLDQQDTILQIRHAKPRNGSRQPPGSWTTAARN